MLAQVPLPAGGMWEDLCFWAQQAAELAIKAVYQQHGWLFPFIHDLARLLNGLHMNVEHEWSCIGKKLRGKGPSPGNRGITPARKIITNA